MIPRFAKLGTVPKRRFKLRVKRELEMTVINTLQVIEAVNERHRIDDD